MIKKFNKHPHLGIRLRIPRSINTRDKANALSNTRTNEVQPHYWGSLIKFNSTYLELIDINYQRKGYLGIIICLLSIIAFPMFYYTITNPPSIAEYNDSPVGVILFFIGIIVISCFILFLLFQEFFIFTHFPVRLNRMTRMAHVFRTNGTVLTIPWDKLHFSLTETHWLGIPKAYIAAHVLDENEQVIQEAFVLGGYLTPSPEIALSLWEYCRRYMEEGPEFAAQDKLMYCLPIDKQKESFDLGDTLIRFSMWVPGTRAMGDFMSIILFGESVARWLANMTCRIPKWPKEIEDACKIEPDDPYVRDGSTNDVRASLAPVELGFR